MMYSRSVKGLWNCFGVGKGMMFGYGAGHLSGNWFISMTFMLIFTALTVTAIVLLLRKISKLNKRHENDTAVLELKTRFAKGEITQEEYLRMKDFLDLHNN